MLKIGRKSLIAILSLLFALSSVAIALPGQADSLDFRLRTADGSEVTSASLRGNVVVLAFGASWLPLSKTQMQVLQELAETSAGKNVRVFWVSTDSDKQGSKNYASDAQLVELARKNGLKVPVLRDPDGVFLKRTGADQLPVTIILDRDGRISGAPIGGISTEPKNKLVDLLTERVNRLL
jgi:peroxiredoxin